MLKSKVVIFLDCTFSSLASTLCLCVVGCWSGVVGCWGRVVGCRGWLVWGRMGGGMVGLGVVVRGGLALIPIKQNKKESTQLKFCILPIRAAQNFQGVIP